MTQQPQTRRKTLFISMRWRMLFPIALVIIIIGMIGAYLLANRMSQNFVISEDNLLIQTSQAVVNRTSTIYESQQSEAQRVAYTQGVAESVLTNDVATLHDTLETLARVANLDSIIVTDPNGVEVAGVLRVQNTTPSDYSLSTQVDLSDQLFTQAILARGQQSSSSFIQTPQGLNLYIAVPIVNDGLLVGVAIVGQRISSIVTDLQASAIADLTIYDSSGNPYYSTLDLTTDTLQDLSIPPETVTQALQSPNPVSASVLLNTTVYRTLYTPFIFGDTTLGVMAINMPDNIPFVSALGRQMVSIFVAMMAGSVILLVFISIDRYATRLDRVTQTAQALSLGLRDSRTGMRPSDEVGAVGAALDQFAAVTQYREDQLRTQLWRQRRERNYIMSAFEAIPEGVIVQDKDGQIVMVNDRARQLLGTQGTLYQDVATIARRLPQLLGRELAPGIYALGNPQNLQQEDRMLNAQAAAILTHTRQRIGTVMLLRDVTEEVKQDRARADLLSHLSQDIQQPLADLASKPQLDSRAVQEFTREISRHAASLQKMIVDMRELTRYAPEHVSHVQRPLLAETLLYAVANDWRQIAQAADLQLNVSIQQTGHYILGDESRLRWAIGNIVDNAVKYTPANGQISLEVKTMKKGRLYLRIRDNGVGISGEDYPHIFDPFYRGTPTQADGSLIYVPGMGQGLHLARQIIRAHGGIMKVKTKLGVGSAVYVALPVTSGQSYSLPLLDDIDMDGETLPIAENADIESIWQ